MVRGLTYLTAIMIVMALLSCSTPKKVEKKFRQVEKKDNLGRVTSVTDYYGNEIQRREEFKYFGNSHNPLSVVYKKNAGLKLVPYKEELYNFKGNNLVKLSFYVYKKSNRLNTGIIKYFYIRNKLKRIEYYSMSLMHNKLFIFGLDQYKYKKGSLFKRRIIEYEPNPSNQKPMQIGHFVITYNGGAAVSMKLSIMDKKSKKIIEKNFNDMELVNDKIEDIEAYYIRRSRGKEFIK